MSDTTAALLRQAYSLIENDELEKAQEILAPLLEKDANNVHLWWVYTHAVRDALSGRRRSSAFWNSIHNIPARVN